MLYPRPTLRTKQQNKAAFENAVEAMTASNMKETEAVFRTAYHMAKKYQPFSDHETLIELQELNSLNMAQYLIHITVQHK